MRPDDSRSTGPTPTSRRAFLGQAGGGFGALALAWLLQQEAAGGDPLSTRAPHFPGQAKRVISLFMHGGPSHLETFDPKPDLQRLAGQPLPASFGAVATRRKVAANPLLGTKRTFRRYGQSGIEVSDFLPHTAKLVDDLAVIRSCWADSVNHPQAVYQMNTGSILMGKPSLGSWVGYGLGTENQRPPGVRRPARSRRRHQGRTSGVWGSGFLPATRIRGRWSAPARAPILDLRAARGDDGRSPEEDAGPDRPPQRIATWNQRGEDSELLEARIRRLRAGFPDAIGRAGGGGPLADETEEVRNASTGSMTTADRPTSARGASWPVGWPSEVSGSSRSTRAT